MSGFAKQTTSTVFAGIDSGFNHLIRPMDIRCLSSLAREMTTGCL